MTNNTKKPTPSSSICNEEPSLKEVFLKYCLNKTDYYCPEEKRDGDHCTSPSYTLYDKNALTEFNNTISSYLNETPIDLNLLKQFINSFQLALYHYKNLNSSKNSENFHVLNKEDLMCGQPEQLTTLNLLIEKIQNSDTTDIRLKTLLLTKLNLFVNKINKLCETTPTGGRRHTKKKNRKQKKTKSSLRSRRY